MDDTNPSGFTFSLLSHPTVPTYGPTWESPLKVLGPGSHLRIQGSAFPVCRKIKSKQTEEENESKKWK